jgi:hypothetical protein
VRWPRSPRWPWFQWLYLALALLYVLPFWLAAFVPTTDGPCHLYNAWVLRHLGDLAGYPAVNRYFEVDARPIPNWLTHLLLAGAMWLVPPLVAEKLLLSGYVLLFLGGLWYLAGAIDGDRRWLAFAGFLFVFSVPLQSGFYNFCYSLGLFCFAVGYWWRRRDSFDLGAAVKLNLLLWLCYFAHIVSTIVALLAIAVLWLATLRRASLKPRLLQIPALAPQLVLPVWFVWTQGRGEPWPTPPFGELWATLFHFSAFLGVESQAGFGIVLQAVFALLLVLSLAVRLRAGAMADPGLGFLLLSMLLAVLFFVAPEGMAGGGGLKMRLAVYPWLVLLPWLAPTLTSSGRARGAAIGVLALLALLNLAVVSRFYAVAGREMQPFVRGLERLPAQSVFVPLLFERWRGCARPCYLAHASGYAAIDRRLVDWDDYEAVTGYFPLRFQPAARHDTQSIEALPWRVDPRALARQVDYVACWKLPPDSASARRLRQDLVLAAVSGDWQLYRSPYATK